MAASRSVFGHLLIITEVKKAYYKMNKELKWKFFLVAILVVFFGLSIYKNGLKPGIDLAGGSSLLYEIDTTGMPEAERRGVSEDMIRILRQRIDPSNQLGLIWRPHGVDKIEIQVPLATEETRKLMKEYKDNLAELEKSGINMIAVKQALVHPEGKTKEEYIASRTEQFAALADGNAERQAILDELAVAYDNKEAAKAEQSVALEKVDNIAKQAKEASVEEYQLSSLVRRWDTLDDPNRIAEVNKIAKDDAALAEQIRTYVAERKNVSQLREKLTGEEGLIEQVDDILRRLERSNINIDRFEKYLAANPKRRAEELDALKNAHPKLETLINNIETAYDQYAGVAGRLDDPEDLKRLLRGSGVLEFRILPTADTPDVVVSDYMNKLSEFGPVKASTDKYVWRPIRDVKAFTCPSAIIGQYVEEYYVLCSNKDAEKLTGSGDNTWKLKAAFPDQDQYGSPAVSFAFNTKGSELFYDLTKNNIERPLCILLDEKAISAPNINSAINGRGIITGSFTYKQVVELSDKLKAGSLPARLSDEPISENNIGPTLGKDNLEAGFKAGLIGLAAVIIFMLVYYTFAGALADVALALNMLFIIGVMSFSKATFTMPGIAALILTVGMAVDANVLIFERVREEMKAGSSLKIAIKNGYERAFWTIFDANLTTFIVALILWVMASEEIKGFALALMIGIVSSMFTALFVTRAIFEWLLDSEKLHDKLSMMHLMDHPSVSWLKLKPVFWTCSAILVLGGWFMTANRSGDSNSLYSIEFTGGTSAQVRLNADKANELLAADEQSMNAQDKGLVLRGKIEDMVSSNTDDPEIAACRVQQVGAPDKLEYEIVTTATNLVTTLITPGEGDPKTAAELEAKLKQVATDMGDNRLSNSSFEQKGNAFELETHQTSINVVKKALGRAFPNSTYSEPVVNNLVGKTIINALGEYLNVIKNLEPSNIVATPITEDLISKKPYLGAYSGGVLLTADFAPGKNETLDRIKDRFERTQLLTNFEQYDYNDSVFFAPDNTGSDQPLGSIEMVTHSIDVVYGISDDDEWGAFVNNEKGRFTDALRLQTSFTRLTQIDPSVGSKSMTDAIISIVVSLMAIVAYVWFRFGNIRFGLAAVTALVHDVSISLGLVALTAAISNTALGRMLLISDFKIDLPVIAAFLTVIGYSLNDTIVVFDRIRENRGKKTVLTGDMINSSINQTLSRTVLTSLTTLLVLVVMYIWGGTGLRAFNFVLIVGVVVGTYSSIAIASPLLVGAVDIEPEDESGPVSEGVAMN